MKQNMNYINALPDFLAMQSKFFVGLLLRVYEEWLYSLEFMILVKILNI
jgi:hypothetical protein